MFISAYSIRKLLEAEQIGSDFPMWNHPVSKFLKKSGNTIDFMNNHHFDKFYDFENPIHDSMSLKFLADTLIHSYIFTLQINDAHEVTGFLFNSEFTKEEYLYEMPLERFTNLLQWIGYSSVYSAHFTRKPKHRSEFKITREYGFDPRIPRKGLSKKILSKMQNLDALEGGYKP